MDDHDASSAAVVDDDASSRSVELVHVGAAGSVSCRRGAVVAVAVQDDDAAEDAEDDPGADRTAMLLAYASHGMIHLASSSSSCRRRRRNRTTTTAPSVPSSSEHQRERQQQQQQQQLPTPPTPPPPLLWRRRRSLRTREIERASSSTASMNDDHQQEDVVTCLTQVRTTASAASSTSTSADATTTTTTTVILACGFSTGRILLWSRRNRKNNNAASENDDGYIEGDWTEHVVVAAPAASSGGKKGRRRSVTVVDAAAVVAIDRRRRKAASTENNKSRGGGGGDDDQDADRNGEDGEEIISILLVAGSSSGAVLYEVELSLAVATTATATASRSSSSLEDDDATDNNNNNGGAANCAATIVKQHRLTTTPVCSAYVAAAATGSTAATTIFVGTAAPRGNNRIHVWTATAATGGGCGTDDDDDDSAAATTTATAGIAFDPPVLYAGSLSGHEDWITDFDFTTTTTTTTTAKKKKKKKAAATNESDDDRDGDRDDFFDEERLLASSSQDCKIRLWKFSSTSRGGGTCRNNVNDSPAVESAPDRQDDGENTDRNNNNDDDGIDGGDIRRHEHENEEDEEEGEARLEFAHYYRCCRRDDNNNGRTTTTRIATTTRVTLEALLAGHEAAVTSVQWHPDPSRLYNRSSSSSSSSSSEVLMSSSMDRTILLWSCSDGSSSGDEGDGGGGGGIWTPITRVGGAGGILGGPVGSSLLGYCGAVFEPLRGRCIVAHAYGGALHAWSVEEEEEEEEEEGGVCQTPSVPLRIEETKGGDGGVLFSEEERASLVKWKASPGLTGHFAGVNDLCWEASRGSYLLTAGNDQTCRLWAPVVGSGHGGNGENPDIWIELGRPQVHGYGMTSVTSLSTPERPHLLVTAAGEKELRVFDAPKATLRALEVFSGIPPPPRGDDERRVERAYIPSLGLTNKATAADGAEEDEQQPDTGDVDDDTTDARIPSERDLGAVSIWPEIRKLFGHNTELYCLASTLEAKCAGNMYAPSHVALSSRDVIVASSAKARDSDAAAIRLWDVADRQRCLQVLEGGHKSTVATLSFSPDGRYLASAGKDRRLCLWKRDCNDAVKFGLAWARDSAHKRIIWSVNFCPFDETVLASGSRDGYVKLWKIRDRAQQGDVRDMEQAFEVDCYSSFTPSFVRPSDGKADAVTAVSFAPTPSSSTARRGSKQENAANSIIAVGLESGRIELWRVPILANAAVDTTAGVSSPPPIRLRAVPARDCHIATVTKLAWRPLAAEDELDGAVAAPKRRYLYLASSSADHSCRIFRLLL